MRSAAGAVLLAVLSVGASCAGVPEDPRWQERCARYTLEAIPPPDGAARVLSGFAPRAAGDEPVLGDELLYSVRVSGGGEVRELLLLLEMPPALVGEWKGQRILFEERRPDWRLRFTRDDGTAFVHVSKQKAVDVALFDGEGHPLDRGEGSLPYTFLFHGLTLAGEKRGRLTPRDRRDLIAVAVAMSRLAEGNEVLSKVMLDFADFSIWSAIIGLGVSIDLELDLDGAKSVVRDPIGGPYPGPRYLIPVELALNGKPAIRGQLLVGDPARPLGMSGGVLAASGIRAADPSHRIDVRLIAAARGGGS